MRNKFFAIVGLILATTGSLQAQNLGSRVELNPVTVDAVVRGASDLIQTGVKLQDLSVYTVHYTDNGAKSTVAFSTSGRAVKSFSYAKPIVSNVQPQTKFDQTITGDLVLALVAATPGWRAHASAIHYSGNVGSTITHPFADRPQIYWVAFAPDHTLTEGRCSSTRSFSVDEKTLKVVPLAVIC